MNRGQAPDHEVTGPINIGNPVEFTMLELTGSASGIEHRPLPQDDPTRRRPDTSRARESLGWEPRTAVRDGLERTIRYFIDLGTR